MSWLQETRRVLRRQAKQEAKRKEQERQAEWAAAEREVNKIRVRDQETYPLIDTWYRWRIGKMVRNIRKLLWPRSDLHADIVHHDEVLSLIPRGSWRSASKFYDQTLLVAKISHEEAIERTIDYHTSTYMGKVPDFTITLSADEVVINDNTYSREEIDGPKALKRVIDDILAEELNNQSSF